MLLSGVFPTLFPQAGPRPFLSALTKAGTGTTSRGRQTAMPAPGLFNVPHSESPSFSLQNLSPADRDTVSSLLPVQGDLFEGTSDSLHAAQNYPQFTPPHSERSAIFLSGGSVPLPCCLCRTAYTQNEIALILPTLPRCSVTMYLSVRRRASASLGRNKRTGTIYPAGHSAADAGLPRQFPAGQRSAPG